MRRGRDVGDLDTYNKGAAMSENDSPFEESEQVRSQDVDADAWETPSRHQGRSFMTGSWVGGAVLIALGIIFLLQNAGVDIPFLRNWWAIFILFPAVSSLSQAWRVYQSNGQRFTSHVSGPVVGGLAMVLVAATFLFGLSWSLIWPVFLILAGLGALVGGLASR
jgi:LiaF transmembrane domain